MAQKKTKVKSEGANRITLFSAFRHPPAVRHENLCHVLQLSRIEAIEADHVASEGRQFVLVMNFLKIR